MKITKNKLKRIIQEELRSLNEEGQLVAPVDDSSEDTPQQQQPIDRLKGLPLGERYERRLHSSNPVLAEGNNKGWKNLVADLVMTATSFTRGWAEMKTVLDRHLDGSGEDQGGQG